jgi:TPR repeat protein
LPRCAAPRSLFGLAALLGCPFGQFYFALFLRTGYAGVPANPALVGGLAPRPPARPLRPCRLPAGLHVQAEDLCARAGPQLAAMAAEDGHPSQAEALTCLGGLYHHGLGRARSEADALSCYHSAADMGDGRAANNIGVCHQMGYGVPADPVK